MDPHLLRKMAYSVPEMGSDRLVSDGGVTLGRALCVSVSSVSLSV